jgi:DNA-binding protein YbaB
MTGEIENLEKELKKMEEEVLKAKEKLKKKGTKSSARATGVEISQFKVNYKMNLIANEGSYMLIIDS